MTGRRRVLVTGVGRQIGIGAAVAAALRDDGWDVVTCGYRDYDARMAWGADVDVLADLDADFADPAEPSRIVSAATVDGPLTALVLCHCESVDSGVHDTTIESWDRHFAVNARSVWLLVRCFAEQFPGPPGTGRIAAFTSDALVNNLPYGASKGALDRIIVGAAAELAGVGITANVINPGATETGWMDEATRASVLERNLQPRVGAPADAANLTRFLLSEHGAWINGQILYSDGGLR